MSKIHIAAEFASKIGANSNPTVTPFAYRRPRCAVRHLRRQFTVRGTARIAGQVTVSASLISAGIMVTGPGGALLAFAGICLAFCTSDEQTPEQYREAVIAHFSERGKSPPRWTCQGDVQ